MASDHYITVGIPTAGPPQLESRGEVTLLRNMLIGKDFHWQKGIDAILPGEIILSGDPTFPILNRLPLETYLKCVVGSEMNPNAPIEFLKAHAVISRSWALGKIIGCHNHSEEGKIDTPEKIVNWEDTCDHSGFDVCSDDHCQRYQGLQPLPEIAAAALDATAGEVLVDPNGNLVDARFSKCCGGRTELFSSCWQPRDPACLESFPDPWCNLDDLPPSDRQKVLGAILKDYDLQNSGGYSWSAEIRSSDIRRNLLSKFGRDIGEILNIEILERGPSGRSTLLRLYGSSAILDIGKELMIRRLLSPTHLYSSRFDIRKDTSDPQLWHISGHGWGHGVGLCQIGAARMALASYSYSQILSFYYPASRLSPIKYLSP